MNSIVRNIHVRRKNNSIQIIQVENISNIDELLAFAKKITSERIEVPYKGNKIVAFGGMRDGELLCIKNPENGELLWPIKQKPNMQNDDKEITNQRIVIPNIPPKIQNKIEEPKKIREIKDTVIDDVSDIDNKNRINILTKYTPDDSPTENVDVQNISNRIRHEIGTEFISVNTLPSTIIKNTEQAANQNNDNPIESELDAIEREYLKLRKNKSENSNNQEKSAIIANKNALKKYTVRVLRNNNIEIIDVENETYSKVRDYFITQIENGLYDDIIDIYLNKFVWSNKPLKEKLRAEGKL